MPFYGYKSAGRFPIWRRPAQYPTMNTLSDTIAVAVHSTMLQAVAYDAAARLLTLTFHDGAVYEYGNVPPSVYDALLRAESKGEYVHAHIIDRYPYRKVRAA